MEQPTPKVDSETLLEDLRRRAIEIQRLEFELDQLKAGLMRALRNYEIKKGSPHD